VNGREPFEIHQSVHSVPGGETAVSVMLVLKHSVLQIAGDTCIERL